MGGAELLLALLLAPLPVAAGWFGRVLWLESRPDRVPILLYHRILPFEAARRGEVRDEEMIYACYDVRFQEQMQLLHDDGWTTLDLDEWIEIREGRRAPVAKPVIVTFDDGYRSTWSEAFPVMRRLGQKLVLYHALEPDAHTRRQVEGCDDFLTAEQLREMSEHGMSIQSHSLTHGLLYELPDEEVRHELEASRKGIEAITGRPVRHFCIPRAGGSRRVERLIREAGYVSWSGNRKGTASGRSPLHGLPRIVVERDMDLDDFRRLLRPPTSALVRVVGEIKAVPGRLAGGRFGRRLRDRLYGERTAPLFRSRNLRRLLVGSCLAYLSGIGVLAWHVLAS